MNGLVVQALASALPVILLIYVINLLRDWMKIQTAIWPNRMVRRQKWRYWAHRIGYLYSPSCGTLGIPFADLKRSKPGVAYGWINCAFCGWSTRHRKDVHDQMNPKNWREYERHTQAHKYPSRPIQHKHPTDS